MRETRPAAPMVVRLDRDQLPRIRALLAQSGLSPEGLEADHVLLFVTPDGEAPSGCAAVEVFGETGLLRSVAVAPARRGVGLGRALVAEAEEEARREGVRMLYLLTETAEDFFAALGYRVVGREGLPGAVERSGQFKTMCPASAVVMTRDL